MRRMVYNTGCSVSARGEIGYRSGFRFQRLGVQVPPGGPKKQDAAFAASCFFSPEGAEPPRNFAKQNAALFREGVRNRGRGEQRESAGQVPPWRLVRRAQNPTQFCEAKCSTFPRRGEKQGQRGATGKCRSSPSVAAAREGAGRSKKSYHASDGIFRFSFFIIPSLPLLDRIF